MKPLLLYLFAGAALGAGATIGAQAAAPAAPAARECLSPAAWTMLDGSQFRAASPGDVLSSIVKRDVVLLGESHLDDDHHRWQLQALAALAAARPNIRIGFEMFPRRLQPVLERWVAGELTTKQFQEQSEWDTVWNVPFELYLPLFQFARINRIPMLALNVERKLNKTITEVGWDKVPLAEREGVGRAASPSAAYEDFLFEVYRQHTAMHGKDDGKAGKSDKAFRNFVESQTTWDRAMAEALARPLKAAAPGGKPLMVGIMGSAHLRFGYGVPHQLRDLGVADVASLLPLGAGFDCKELRPGLADAVFSLPPQAAGVPEPPRLGVQLDQNEDSVQIATVTAGSLAERSGLKSGDRLIELGGAPVSKVAAVIAAIRAQPAGSWLPLRLKRGNDTLELVLKFPPKP